MAQCCNTLWHAPWCAPGIHRATAGVHGACGEADMGLGDALPIQIPPFETGLLREVHQLQGRTGWVNTPGDQRQAAPLTLSLKRGTCSFLVSSMCRMVSTATTTPGWTEGGFKLVPVSAHTSGDWSLTGPADACERPLLLQQVQRTPADAHDIKCTPILGSAHEALGHIACEQHDLEPARGSTGKSC